MKGVYDLTVTTLAQSEVSYGSQLASNYTLPGGGDIILNGATVTLTAGDSLQTIANTINSATFGSGQKVTASVIDNRLVFQSETGAAATIHERQLEPPHL